MYDIFKRINTGGTPLNAQEIRHCMSKDRSRDILKRMTSTDEFNRATNWRNHIRMNDREMALRFAGFWLLGSTGTRSTPPWSPSSSTRRPCWTTSGPSPPSAWNS
ncbi:hypothetical protein ACR6C2_34745 [Streptomyces sp. INA 01156]